MRARIKKVNDAHFTGKYLTKDKWYKINELYSSFDPVSFVIVDDEGAEIYCLQYGCAHLGEGDSEWELDLSDTDDTDDKEDQ